jgi:hypothetical protein
MEENDVCVDDKVGYIRGIPLVRDDWCSESGIRIGDMCPHVPPSNLKKPLQATVL